MKKFISIFLIVSLMLTLFAGCGKEKTSDDESNKKPSTTVGVNGEVNDDVPSVDVDKIDMTKATFGVTEFKNGIAIVPCKEGQGTVTNYIDKKGNVLYQASGEIMAMYGEEVSPNGVCWVKDPTARYDYLLDVKNQKVIKAEDLGGTNIVAVVDGAFSDGYIFVEKIETTYDGSTKWIAVYNDKFEMIYDFSTELHEFLYTTGYCSVDTYNEGYVYSNHSKDDNTGKYFDLKTMTYGDDWLCVPTNAGDWSELLNDEKFDNSFRRGDFTDGSAGVSFNSEGTFYFSIVDTEGNFFFEPIQTKGFEISGENGQYVVYGGDTDNLYVEIFDKTGKKGEIVIPNKGYDGFYCTYSDNTILIECTFWRETETKKNYVCFYDMNGNKLF